MGRLLPLALLLVCLPWPAAAAPAPAAQAIQASPATDLGQGRYVGPATRAALGRIQGAELAVQGGSQRAGAALRVTARLMRTETGEIVDTLSVTGPAAEPFPLQDRLARELLLRIQTLGPER